MGPDPIFGVPSPLSSPERQYSQIDQVAVEKGETGPFAGTIGEGRLQFATVSAVMFVPVAATEQIDSD